MGFFPTLTCGVFVLVLYPRLLLLLPVLPPQHTLTHTHSLTLTHTQSLTLTHTHSLTHTLTLTHSLTLTLTLSLSHSHSLTFTHTHTHSLTHTHNSHNSHNPSTHSLTHSLPHSLYLNIHTHTQTHLPTYIPTYIPPSSLHHSHTSSSLLAFSAQSKSKEVGTCGVIRSFNCWIAPRCIFTHRFPGWQRRKGCDWSTCQPR